MPTASETKTKLSTGLSTLSCLDGMSPATGGGFCGQNTMSSEAHNIPPFAALVKAGDHDEVRLALEAGSDPNMEVPEMVFAHKKFLECSMLAIAVNTRNFHSVRLLIHHRADPNSKYTLLAGARKMRWRAPASYCCMPHGDLNMLKELVSLSANP